MLVAARCRSMPFAVSPASAHVGGAIGDAELNRVSGPDRCGHRSARPAVGRRANGSAKRYRPMADRHLAGRPWPAGMRRTSRCNPKMPSSQDLFLVFRAGGRRGRYFQRVPIAPSRHCAKNGGHVADRAGNGKARGPLRAPDRRARLCDAEGGRRALLTVTLPERSDPPASRQSRAPGSKLHTHMGGSMSRLTWLLWRWLLALPGFSVQAQSGPDEPVVFPRNVDNERHRAIRLHDGMGSGSRTSGLS